MSNSLDIMLEAVPDGYQKTVGYPTYDILAAAGIRLDQTEQLLAETERKLDPANLGGEELEAYIYPRTGQRRNPATYALGVLTVTGSGTVHAGDLFESEGGVQFAATGEVAVSETAQVPVRATAGGAQGNLPPGTVTEMPVQLQGIVSCTNEAATHDGYDTETDEAYYTRFLIRVQTPPTSGNVYHYMLWALEVSGVGGAQVYPLGHGDNTVDVVLVDVDGRPAGRELVAAVQKHIDPDSQGLGRGEAPIGAYCYVSAAEAKTINLSARVMLLPGEDRETVTAAIRARVTDYLKSIAFRQDYVSYGRIAETVLDTPGVRDFEDLRLNGGTANVAVAARQVAVLGEAAISYAP